MLNDLSTAQADVVVSLPSMAADSKPTQPHHIPAGTGFLSDFLIGGTAGAATTIALFPFRHGLSQLATNQLSNTNVLGLWRGAAAAAGAGFFPVGTAMALKDHYRRVFNRGVDVGSYRRLSVGNLAAGTASGATICLLVDLWGRLFKFASERPDFVGFDTEKERQAIKRLKPMLASHGGIGLRTFIHSSVASGIYFGGYDSLKLVFFQDSFLGCCGLSWAAFAASQLTLRPTDNVCKKLEAAGAKEIRWKEFKDMFFQVVGKEGVGALFKGPKLRNFSAAAVLPFYDLLQRLLVQSDGFRSKW